MMVAPAICLSCLLVIGPFAYVVWESFRVEGSPSFTLANFHYLQGIDFTSSLQNSLYIGIVSVILEVLVAVPLALLLNRKIPGRGIMRALVTLPWAVPTIAVANAFLWLDDTSYGIFNQIGIATGVLRQPLAFLGDPSLALPAVTVATAWKGVPLVFIIVLSALQSLSHEYLEAATIDGAGAWARFWYITLPHLRPSIALAAVLSGIYNFALFDIPFLLTSGGPAGTTTTLPELLYNQDFLALNTPRASAIGVVIFLFGAIALVIVFLTTATRRERSA